MYKEYTDRPRELEAQLRRKDDTEAWLRQALARAEEKLVHSERETEYLRAQLNKLRRMTFGHSSEKITRKIAALETKLKQLEREGDAYSGRVNDPVVPRPLRQTRTRKPFPESLPREEHRLLPVEKACPDCGDALSWLGEDAAEQLELIRSAFRVIRTVREKHCLPEVRRIVQTPSPSRPIERASRERACWRGY